MKIQLAGANQGDARLARTVAITFIAAMAILALYFGQDVLIPVAVAVLFAFILGPAVTWLRRLLPLPLAVAVVVLGAVVAAGLLTVLIMTQLAEVAGSLVGYQTNLHQKIQDVRGLSEGAGPLSRFISMVASLAQDLGRGQPGAGAGGARPEQRVELRQRRRLRGAAAASAADRRHRRRARGLHPARPRPSQRPVRAAVRRQRRACDVGGRGRRRRSRRPRAVAAGADQFRLRVAGKRRLFALGMPNAVLWGLLAGALRFIPYVGAVLGALLPTLIAFAVMPGWLQPFLVLGMIVGLDLVIGQLVEPLLFGESTGVTPLALILSAIFWGTLWGPIGLLLSTPLTICLLVLGTHVPHLGFLQVLLGDEPALAPYQQIYRRLIRKAVADAAAVALAEIEEKGAEHGLDDGWGAWSSWPKRTARSSAGRRADRRHRRRHRRGARFPRRHADEGAQLPEAMPPPWRPARPAPPFVASAAAARSTTPRRRSSPSPCAGTAWRHRAADAATPPRRARATDRSLSP